MSAPPAMLRARSLDSTRDAARPLQRPQKRLAAPRLQLPAKKKDASVSPRHPSPRRLEEVSIDSLTTVPAELYDNFLRAGVRAKARGQHRLEVDWGADRTKVRLVKSQR
mmetsp:Transcript_53791/g.99433  ORF Transcript_53791/g.99433 Transcript_53791/m.99433 type:complete len:109 (-) Transcript_53791:276-602(-)